MTAYFGHEEEQENTPGPEFGTMRGLASTAETDAYGAPAAVNPENMPGLTKMEDVADEETRESLKKIKTTKTPATEQATDETPELKDWRTAPKRESSKPITKPVRRPSHPGVEKKVPLTDAERLHQRMKNDYPEIESIYSFVFDPKMDTETVSELNAAIARHEAPQKIKKIIEKYLERRQKPKRSLFGRIFNRE